MVLIFDMCMFAKTTKCLCILSPHTSILMTTSYTTICNAFLVAKGRKKQFTAMNTFYEWCEVHVLDVLIYRSFWAKSLEKCNRKTRNEYLRLEGICLNKTFAKLK